MQEGQGALQCGGIRSAWASVDAEVGTYVDRVHRERVREAEGTVEGEGRVVRCRRLAILVLHSQWGRVLGVAYYHLASLLVIVELCYEAFIRRPRRRRAGGNPQAP